MVYKSGRVYDRLKLSRGKAKANKKFIFEKEDDFKAIKYKMVDFIKEKSLELKGFVEETTESARETLEVVDSEDENYFEEAETVEMVDSGGHVG